ncbi:hypothetical protein AALP_AA8G080000 [Arabis alpina]|uniref:Uncharacterized protein n=1 Tax=Arabis alpina TaxID=50452 RepID=A0A087G5P5_ARAAL|nr:hypothetical protein AALP_AA8G080000 [Arabis alpina]
MKKRTQLASLFLSLLHIFLLCLSFQIRATEARLLGVDEAPPPPPPLPPPVPLPPSRPCGSNIGSQIMRTRETPCRQVPRHHHHHASVPRPPRKN